MFKIIFSTIFLLYFNQNILTTAEEIDLSDDYYGSCWLKAWTGVAECRKGFVDQIDNRSDDERCCLYRILEECSIDKSAKMCGKNVVNATEAHLKKYRKMINDIDCDKIQLNSKECFWLLWDNYITCGLFLIVVMIILTYTVRWYIIQ